MNGYNYPNSTIYAQSSSYFTNPTMASIPSTLPWQHSVDDMVNNFIQPIENKLSQWFWQGISTLLQNNVVLAKIDKLKEQIVADLPQDKFLLEEQHKEIKNSISKCNISLN